MAVRRVSRRTRRSRRAVTPRAPKRPRSRRSVRRASRKVSRKTRKPKMKVGSMRRVWSGTCDKTKGGLTKKDLMVNKRGKVVSKKANKSATKNFKSNGLHKWTAACQKARSELGLTGFVACKKGSAFYKLAKQYYN